MKKFLLVLCVLLSSPLLSQVYTISGNFSRAFTTLNIPNTSFSDLRNERRITYGSSYGISVARYFEKGYYQSKFWGIKLDLSKTKINQDIRIVPSGVNLTQLKYIDKRVEINVLSLSPVFSRYPSIGQSLYFEVGPSLNIITGNKITTNLNDFTYDVEIYDYKLVKSYIGVYVKGGLYMNIIEGFAITTSIYGKTNVTPIVIDKSFNTYIIGLDIGLTIRIKE
jgi:hypothetical protein